MEINVPENEEMELKYIYDNYNKAKKIKKMISPQIMLISLIMFSIIIKEIGLEYIKDYIFFLISMIIIFALTFLSRYLYCHWVLKENDTIIKNGMKFKYEIQDVSKWKARHYNYGAIKIKNNESVYMVTDIEVNETFSLLYKYYRHISAENAERLKEYLDENKNRIEREEARIWMKENNIKPKLITVDVYIYGEKYYADLKSIDLRFLNNL